jgi:aminoglycoside 3-N-acetyltransferase
VIDLRRLDQNELILKKKTKKLVIRLLNISRIYGHQEIFYRLYLKYRRFFFTKKYDENILLDLLISIGLKPSQTVFIHSSWDEFYNFKGNPWSLIKQILETIGPAGTLAMPAFPQKQDPKIIFDVKRTPSGAGLLTEIFRRYPGVKRSINQNHSVCAIGPNAEFLTKDHHCSKTSWDRLSPYYRLKELNAQIIGLGVGKNLRVATALHCADSILKDEIFYFSQLFNEKITYSFLDQNGVPGTHTYFPSKGSISTRNISRHMSSDHFRETKLSNLDIYSIDAEYLIDRIIELGRTGITMYKNPRPKKSLFFKLN